MDLVGGSTRSLSGTLSKAALSWGLGRTLVLKDLVGGEEVRTG